MKKFLIFASFFLLLYGCDAQITNRESPGEAIICFGNSITEGVGAGDGEDYPSLLSRKFNRPVVNAGRRGDTTKDALGRFEQDVLSKNPRLVIVELGANDFLRQLSAEETFGNLDEIVQRIQGRGAMVVLAEVKTGLIRDHYYDGFKEIAEKRGALFIPDILAGIIYNPELKSDGLHPNAAGYKIVAERIYKKIKPLVE